MAQSIRRPSSAASEFQLDVYRAQRREMDIGFCRRVAQVLLAERKKTGEDPATVIEIAKAVAESDEPLAVFNQSGLSGYFIWPVFLKRAAESLLSAPYGDPRKFATSAAFLEYRATVVALAGESRPLVIVAKVPRIDGLVLSPVDGQVSGYNVSVGAAWFAIETVSVFARRIFPTESSYGENDRE